MQGNSRHGTADLCCALVQGAGVSDVAQPHIGDPVPGRRAWRECRSKTAAGAVPVVCSWKEKAGTRDRREIPFFLVAFQTRSGLPKSLGNAVCRLLVPVVTEQNTEG